MDSNLKDKNILKKTFNSGFFTSADSREPESSGILGAILGSAMAMVVTMFLALPFAVMAAIYLEYFAKPGKLTDFIEVNINNLAAVPSIVFGLLGLAVFLNFFQLPRSAPLVGGMVLALMTLPTIIIASRASIRAVPPSIRDAALGLGASKMQAAVDHVLPLASPGILTGTIIGMAQALGETAPLIMIGMVVFLVDIPTGFTDTATALPVQIYIWSDSAERAFYERSSLAIMFLVLFLIGMNLLAVLLRKKFEKNGRIFSMSDEIKIQVKNVNVFYGDIQALFDVNLDIKSKEITSLIGPSGCGKSTFLRCMNRMNDVIDGCRVEGKITIDGENIYDADKDPVLLRARVGMVFQKPNPFPKTIFENVAYGPKIHGLATNTSELREIVENSLEQAGLMDEVKDRLNDSATDLSGGQQQRICIARAIAVNPEIILMDEPCSALDPIATARVEDLMGNLSNNYTIVIVTHSMQQAARVSTNTAFFHLGHLVEFNETKKIFTNPNDKRTEDYITGKVG